MSAVSASRSDLTTLLLIACDKAYDINITPGTTVLDSFPDSPIPGLADGYPASMPTRWAELGFNQWIARDRFDDAATGFGATLFRKSNVDGTADYIVAMQGTRGPNIQDWSGNLIYGWDKWTSPTGAEARRLRAVLGGLSDVNNIHFTGQSLGGALAEYALYDYATAARNIEATKVTLTTFNGLGGVEALTQNHGNIDTSKFAAVDTAHFYITNDLVSRLGGGHLNGQGHEYLLSFWQTDPDTGLTRRREDGSPIALNPFEAHRIESGFYSGFNRAPRSQDPGWPSDFTGALPASIAPLAIGRLAQTGTAFAWLSNQDGALPTDQEAWARAIAAVTYALAFGSRDEIRALVTAVNDSLYASDLISSKALKGLLSYALADFLPAFAASPSGRATEMAAYYVALLAETSGESGTVDISREVVSRAVELVAGAGPAGATTEFAAIAVGAAAAQVLSADAGRLRSAVLYVKAAGFAALAVLLVTPSLALSVQEAAIANLLELAGSTPDDAAAFARRAPLMIGQALAGGAGDVIASTLSTTSRALIDAAAEVSKSAATLAIDAGGFVGQARDAVSAGLSDVAMSISNAYSDLTLKFADAVEWGGAVPRATLDALLGALLSEARADIGETGPDFGDAIGRLELAAQRAAIRQGRVANPFDQGSFDPDSEPLSLGALAEGSIQPFTVYLPYEAGAGGQRITFTFGATAPGGLAVLAGGEEATLGSDGSFALIVPEGRRELSFELLGKQDIDAAATLKLSAQLVDAWGTPTHLEHVALELALDAVDEAAPETTREIRGDWAPMTYTDPTTGRVYYKYDDLGNIERDPGSINTFYKQPDDLKGSRGPDHLVTGDFDDTAYGFSGDDFMVGSESTGNWLVGGPGSDRIEAGGYANHATDYTELDYLGRTIKLGDDKLYAGAGDDQVWGESEAAQSQLFDPAAAPTNMPGDWIDGGTGNDRLYGSAGDDVLLGGAGEDHLAGGAGMDVLLGDDSFAIRPEGNYWRVLHPAFGDATPGFGGFELGLFPVINYYPNMSLPDFVDPNTGDPYFVYYKNGGGDDGLDGGAGDDILIGQAGDDTLYGGDGDDIVAGWEGDDQLIGGAGNDLMAGDFGRNEQPWQRPVSAALIAVPGVAGSPSSDAGAVAQTGDDFLDGGAGDDMVSGEGGNDIVIGGDGHDVLYGDAPYLPEALHGADILDGGAGDDQLDGGAGDDRLYGGAGEDALAGGPGNDLLDGGSGNDRLLGDEGDDILRGGDGADRLSGAGGRDRLHGGAGDDELEGGEGDDVLFGEGGADVMDGGAGNDVLYGGAGDDRIEAGDGNDTIDGGAGADVLRGGAGEDTYVLSLGYGRDAILDTEGVNRLRFASGVYAEDLGAELDRFTLSATVTYSGMGDAVELDMNRFQLGSLELSDGATWTQRQFLALLPALVTQGSAAGQLLVGNPGLRNDLRGLGGVDTILGSANDDSLAGGDGNDRLDGQSGADRYVFDANETGIDNLADTGIDAFTYLEAYYANLGIADWAYRGEHGGKYRVYEAEGGGDLYFDTYEEAYAAVPYVPIDYIEPLPSIAPLVRRNDSAAIDRLVSDGILSRDVVEIGDGLALGDLSLTVTVPGATADAHPEEPWYGGGTLSVRWNGGAAGFDVKVPDVSYGFVGTNLLTDGNPDDTAPGAWHGYRLGEGVESFAFADGTTYSLEDVLAQAAVAIRHSYDFDRGSGQQTIDASWAGVDFRAGIAPSEVVGARDGTDLVFALTDGSAEGRIVGWYADPAAVPPMSFAFADGTVLDTDAVTRLGLTQHGSPGYDSLVGDPGFASALYGLGGDDTIIGGAGNDLIDSGGGGYLEGGAGEDTYVYGPGYASVEIRDSVSFGGGGLDTLRLGSGIVSQDVTVTGQYGTVTLAIGGGGDEILLDGWTYDPGGTVERIQFADGTVWGAAAIEAMLPAPAATEGDDLLEGTTGGDVLDGLGGNDQVIGYAGSDTLYGGSGDDYLEGVAGGDLLYGGEGADDLEAYTGGASLLDAGAGDDYLHDEGASFIVGGAGDDWIDAYGEGDVIAFNPGDGNDTIYAVGTFTISIGGGAQPGDLALSVDGTDLLLDMGGADSIRLTRQWEADPTAWPSITAQMFGSVHEYDFNAVIADYEAAAAGDPSFVLPLGALLAAHETSVSQTDALGGALAWQYATTGSTAALSTEDLRAVLADPGFGSAPQPITLAAANHAPRAFDDTGAAQEDGGPVLLPAAALLANDTDIDAGDTKSIVAVTGSAANASVTLVDGDVLYDPGSLFQSLGEGATSADTFAYTMADSAGATSDAIVAMTITGKNDAPAVASPIGDQSGRELQAFGFAPPAGAFSDVDSGDFLTLSAALADGNALPAWLGFDPAGGGFSGTPGLADGGEYRVRVTATDPSGATATADFALTVFDAFAAGGRIVGGKGNDVLNGTAAGEVLDGGRGDDLLSGGAGADIYLYNRGAGDDLIVEAGRAGETDVLRFGPGIRPSMLRALRRQNDLVLALTDGRGRVTIRDWFGADEARVERVEFADGHLWDEAAIRALARSEDACAGGPPFHHGRDERDERHPSDGHAGHPRIERESEDEHARDAVRARLAKPARFDFDALLRDLGHRAAEMSRQRDDLRRQWSAVASYASALGDIADDGHGAMWRGPSDWTRLPAGPGARGFGFEGSVAAARGPEGLRPLEGLREGLLRL